MGGFFLVRGSSDSSPTLTFANVDAAEDALKVAFRPQPDGSWWADAAPGTVDESYWVGRFAGRDEVVALHGGAS